MLIPTGMKYTTTLVGREKRDVTCEKCKAEYVYIVSAQGSGTGHSVLFLDEDGAKTRAAGEAYNSMRKQLRHLHLAVPCPVCGWYQEHMVRILKRRRLKIWALVVASPLIWVGIKWAMTDAETPAQLRLYFWLAVSFILAIIATVFHLSWQANVDPKSAIAKDPTSGGIAMTKAQYEELFSAANAAPAQST